MWSMSHAENLRGVSNQQPASSCYLTNVHRAECLSLTINVGHVDS